MKLLALLTIALGGLAAGDAGSTADVAIPGRFYSPPSLAVLVETTVTWRNQDNTTHTVTADDGSFDSGYVAPGGSYERLFSKPGVYAFHCTIHRFMRGVVRVYALVLTGPDHPLVAGSPVVLSGRAPAGNATVTLERTTGRGWEVVRQAALPADGTFVLRTVATEPARYRARAGKTVSPTVSIHVAPVVTAVIRGGSIRVSTKPARAGATAVLETYDRERFTFVGAVTARLDARGGTRLRLPGGKNHLRVLVEGTAGWSAAASRVFLVGVAR